MLGCLRRSVVRHGGHIDIFLVAKHRPYGWLFFAISPCFVTKEANLRLLD
jgi:hypothetical protein